MNAAVIENPAQAKASPAEATALSALIASTLAPLVLDIDTKGTYPEAFLRALGAAGAYRGVVAPASMRAISLRRCLVAGVTMATK